mgnify:CR=1 FL=1
MKRAYFTIADRANMQYFDGLKNSLAKFTQDPLILIDEEKINRLGDPQFYYRATPIIASGLLRDYDAVCKLDADQIILGNLDHIWESDYDVATVRNSNPKEDKVYPVRLLDIAPSHYANCGFVVMKSKVFVEHWLKLCMSGHFNNFQYREQDILNLMIFYMSDKFGGPYKVLDLDEGSKWHGLVFKGYEPQVGLRDDKLVLPKNDEWPLDEDREIVCWHVAGGNIANKMNYKIRFSKEVSNYIDTLVKP